ncbi:SRPBCC family protein [Janibacter terrae]|uniref:SRPBCC family protein n=1 Tax=Janibacter terrae TaxID=103817 RepID=UPI000834E869|nr:SRPBCC family protein [Janibacter terrae]
MSENTTVINASTDDVWSVLSDGWLYPLWVVGASRMRDVDEDWPAVGSRIHHSVGVWPGLIDDHTRVLAQEPQQSITLCARAWPMGEAEVRITLTPAGDRTEVTIVEDAVSGPALLVPGIARQPGLKWRNSETLRRLRLLVEGRSGRAQTA